MTNIVLFLSVCPAGYFGLGCQFHCSCENNGHCHHVTGFCFCKDGWTGPNCGKGKSPQ